MRRKSRQPTHPLQDCDGARQRVNRLVNLNIDPEVVLTGRDIARDLDRDYAARAGRDSRRQTNNRKGYTLVFDICRRWTDLVVSDLPRGVTYGDDVIPGPARERLDVIPIVEIDGVLTGKKGQGNGPNWIYSVATFVDPESGRRRNELVRIFRHRHRKINRRRSERSYRGSRRKVPGDASGKRKQTCGNYECGNDVLKHLVSASTGGGRRAHPTRLCYVPDE